MVRSEFKSEEQEWLRPDHEYVVFSIEEHHTMVAGYRIVSEQAGRPMLFEASHFTITDSSLPRSWVVLGLRGATVQAGPTCLSKAGFWEDYFDGNLAAVDEFIRVRDQIHTESTQKKH
jgi:hypothetical protein